MHLGGLIPFWYYYNKFIKAKIQHHLLILLLYWIGAILYYILLVLPLMIYTNYLFLDNREKFIIFYLNLLSSSSFEIITTSIIVTLYLQQYITNQQLKKHINQVEELIHKRTQQLKISIDEVNSANEELRILNKHLDTLVKERTKELENRNIQLSGFAFINSHLLRAPLARILGLSYIITDEVKSLEEKVLLQKFVQACQELDKIVSLMATTVTEESILELEEIEDLQEQIRLISNEIQSKKS
jgi:signal transduction histidine kinase